MDGPGCGGVHALAWGEARLGQQSRRPLIENKEAKPRRLWLL